MTDLFFPAFKIVVGVEGAFSGDPNDPGNWTGGRVHVGELRGTKYGIAASSHPTLDIPNLTLDDAQVLYRKERWDHYRCGDMPPWGWALTVFDMGTNQSVHCTAMAHQALGITTENGFIGDDSIAAIVADTDGAALARLFEIREAAYRASPLWGRDGKGWMNRLARIHAEAQSEPTASDATSSTAAAPTA